MDVRPATEDDVAAIRGVAEASWAAELAGVVTRETITETVEEWYAEDSIRDAIDDPLAVVLAAENGGSVVGFAHGLLSTSEWIGTILRLYVHPDVRRRGIGTALLDEIVETLRENGADEIQAFVLAGNDLGNDFYRSAGFELFDTGETRIGDEFHEENVYILAE